MVVINNIMAYRLEMIVTKITISSTVIPSTTNIPKMVRWWDQVERNDWSFITPTTATTTYGARCENWHRGGARTCAHRNLHILQPSVAMISGTGRVPWSGLRYEPPNPMTTGHNLIGAWALIASPLHHSGDNLSMICDSCGNLGHVPPHTYWPTAQSAPPFKIA